MSNNRQQISPIPPHPYGERFLNFMSGITMTEEEAARRKQQEGHQQPEKVNAHNTLHHHHIPPEPTVDGHVEVRHSPRNDLVVEKTLDAAQRSADKQTGEKGRRRSEEEQPDRTLLTHTNEARVSTTLPVVQETRETSSHHSSRHDRDSDNEDSEQQPNVASSESHAQHHHPEHIVEYTVTGENCFGSKDHNDEQTMTAPLDSTEQLQLGEHRPQADGHTRPVSKPPRIESGIIPTLDPLLRDEEIGLAK